MSQSLFLSHFLDISLHHFLSDFLTPFLSVLPLLLFHALSHPHLSLFLLLLFSLSISVLLALSLPPDPPDHSLYRFNSIRSIAYLYDYWVSRTLCETDAPIFLWLQRYDGKGFLLIHNPVIPPRALAFLFVFSVTGSWQGDHQHVNVKY